MAEEIKSETGGKDEVINKILSIELKMFLTVNTVAGSSCQDYPESFKLHRRAQFNSWSADTLKSYLDDLENAQTKGVNLMTHKYARMDNLIPPKNSSPIIEDIVEIEFEWQKDMIRNYPYLMSGGRPLSSLEDSNFITSFETYLRGELETYSEKTLELLYKDIMDKQAMGISMARELYSFLVREKGYSSLDEAEKEASNKIPKC